MIDVLDRAREFRNFKVERMILNPALWVTYPNRIPLTWQRVKFHSSEFLNVPNNCCGVYSFVVIPGIADHIACAYLLYVGKTDRDFRSRYKEYLRDQDPNTKTKRFHIYEMLNNWKEHLWFCYAPIPHGNLIEQIEDDLLAAYLPPYCRDFPAKVREPMRVLS